MEVNLSYIYVYIRIICPGAYIKITRVFKINALFICIIFFLSLKSRQTGDVLPLLTPIGGCFEPLFVSLFNVVGPPLVMHLEARVAVGCNWAFWDLSVFRKSFSDIFPNRCSKDNIEEITWGKLASRLRFVQLYITRCTLC